MKILYDCFSCSPYYGSDEEIGWKWPYLMSRYHEVWALVRKDRKEDIEKYCLENEIRHIHFVYCDIPDVMNIYYFNKKRNRNGTMDFLLYQFLWQFVAIHKAKQLHKKYHFDIVHHVCTNDFRLLGYMYRLKIPFIIGPIGGAQEIPHSLKSYVREHKKKEKLRRLINKTMTSLPGYRKALEKADKIYFSNKETLDYLSSKINKIDKCSILTEIGTSNTNTNQTKCRSDEKECVFLWVGRMEYRKGLHFLFDVLKQLPAEKNWRLVLCGDGSERSRLEKMIRDTEFDGRVQFLGRVPHVQVDRLYQEATAFVFPSLRETTGTVILEAMSNALPVISLKQGGAVNIINKKNGFLIPVDNEHDCIRLFAQAMEYFIDNPSEAYTMGQDARQHVLNHFSWDEKIDIMNRTYIEIVKCD